jgi:hypothetical protein
MTRLSTAPVYVSRNHLGGSFTDVPLDGLLAGCLRHQVSGAIDVECGGLSGRVELRAGAVVAAHFGDTIGARALHEMRQLVDGWYELTQRMPDLTGELGGTSVSEGEVERVPLKALMRHCESHALTCTITMVSRHDRAQVEYHAGELRRVELNGFYDDDAIIQVFDWTEARFRVTAPALDIDIQGWPRVREPLPTMARTRFPRGTSPTGIEAVVEAWLEAVPDEELAAHTRAHAAIMGIPINAAPIHAAPINAAPINAAPIDAAPIDAAPINAAPIDAAPISAAPINAAPINAAPIEGMPVATSRAGFTVPARAEVLAADASHALRARARRRRRRVRRALPGLAVLATLLAMTIAMLALR